MSRLFRRRPAGPVYLLIEVGQAFAWALTFTLGLVYQVEVARLDPLQLVLVGTILEASCFLGEIPTGVVADAYSRRLSVIIGVTLIGLGVAVTAVPTFATIALGNVIWGIGYTFTSGATEAWLADEVGDSELQRWFTRATQLGLLANVAGILLAGVLGTLDLRVPLYAGAALFGCLALVLTAVMGEAGFSPVPRGERSSLRSMGASLRTGLAAAQAPGVVRTFLLIAVLSGLTSEVFDRLWTDHVIRSFPLPPLLGHPGAAPWFTAFAVLSAVVSLVASRVANRVAREALQSEHPKGAMAALVALQVAGVIGFALAPWLWAAIAFRLLRQAAAVVASPVRSAWLNRHIAPAARATTLSLMSQADAMGQVVGGPSFGLAAKRLGIATALVVSALAQLPSVPLLLAMRPTGDERAVPSGPADPVP